MELVIKISIVLGGLMAATADFVLLERRIAARGSDLAPKGITAKTARAAVSIKSGLCEEACPVDAIELTSLYNLTGRSREEMIFDKEKLLSVYDQTKESEPMASQPPGESV